MPPLPSNNTRRLLLELTINQQQASTTFRIPNDLAPEDIEQLIVDYGSSITDLHTMTGLVSSTRQSAVSIDVASIAEEASDLFVPFDLTPIQCSLGIGTPEIGDILSLSSITGRCESGQKWILYYPGVAMGIGTGDLSSTYGDMKVSPNEIASLQNWIDAYWGPSGSIRPHLLGIDGSALLFVRPRLLVRYSARKTNSLRKQ